MEELNKLNDIELLIHTIKLIKESEFVHLNSLESLYLLFTINEKENLAKCTQKLINLKISNISNLESKIKLLDKYNFTKFYESD